MSLADLLRHMAPPRHPVEAGGVEEWPRVEGDLGIKLPGDYKAYINAYGTGLIGQFVWPFNPFSDNTHTNLGAQIESQLQTYRDIREIAPLPYPLYPEARGLLPWGGTSNGDVLFWVTQGEPDEWGVVVNPSRMNEYESYSETMTRFLAKLLTRKLVSPSFPDDFPEGDPLFVQLP